MDPVILAIVIGLLLLALMMSSTSSTSPTPASASGSAPGVSKATPATCAPSSAAAASVTGAGVPVAPVIAESAMSAIPDRFATLEQLQDALRHAGLESCNLIIGIDMTRSNEWNGKRSFGGRSLHALLDDERNPYEHAIAVIGRTLSAFDEDGLIPLYLFGDSATRDQSVRQLHPAGRGGPCRGLDEVLNVYRFARPDITLSGPTSFAPLVRQAIQVVRETRQFHVLLILTDGEVTSERETIEAIREASHYALAIVVIGVGDGPWDAMRMLDDRIPGRRFDNLQFVSMHEVERAAGPATFDTAFARAALMELPDQFMAVRKLGLL